MEQLVKPLLTYDIKVLDGHTYYIYLEKFLHNNTIYNIYINSSIYYQMCNNVPRENIDKFIKSMRKGILQGACGTGIKILKGNGLKFNKYIINIE